MGFVKQGLAPGLELIFDAELRVERRSGDNDVLAADGVNVPGVEYIVEVQRVRDVAVGAVGEGGVHQRAAGLVAEEYLVRIVGDGALRKVVRANTDAEAIKAALGELIQAEDAKGLLGDVVDRDKVRDDRIGTGLDVRGGRRPEDRLGL